MANPYSYQYDPSNLYGATGGSNVSMPIVSGPGGFLANNEDAAYYRQVMPFSGGQDALSQYIRSQMTNVLRNFRAAQATNTNLDIQSFLAPLTRASFQQEFKAAAPWARGQASDSQMNAGRMKWYSGSR
jgi:hypothetical protein